MSGCHYDTMPNGKRAYVRNGYSMRTGHFTRDGHGGRAEEHHAEMREESLRAIQETVPYMVEQICNRTWNEALARLIGALEYDINACVNIAFENGEEIFRSEKAKKYVSNAIVKTIQAELKNVKNISIG